MQRPDFLAHAAAVIVDHEVAARVVAGDMQLADAAFRQRIEPVRVSDHACFARAPLTGGAGAVHANDLLPIAHTDESLAIIVANVQHVQERLRRPLLVENLSAYLSYGDDALAEPQFFAELCARSGCAMLLDVNNLMVNALNSLGVRDADDDATARAQAQRLCIAYLDALPAGCIGELHVAGYDASGDLVIDDHGSRVRDEVWALHAHALRRFGAPPTLVEWDTALPALDVLLDEAARANATLAQSVR